MDYHCRAPFCPSVPWCFPVREVHFFKAICWLKDVVNSCGLQRWQTGAKRCQELSRVGPCVLQCSLGFRRDVRPRGLLVQGTIRPSVPWCLPVQEAGQQHQQQPKPAHQKQRSSNNRSSSRAAYSRSRAAGRPCGQVAKSCQELEICVF